MPFGIVMLAISAGAFITDLKWYYGFGHQNWVNSNLVDIVLVVITIYGLAAGILGILLLTFQPRVFLKLNRTGLIVFVVLYASGFFATRALIFCWIPWLVPGLKEKRV